MSPHRRNIIVGLVVLVGLGVVVWMVLFFAGRMANLFAASGLPIHIQSSRADGLSDGSAIYYRGVQTGKVNKVVLQEDGVIIDAEVNPRPALPANLRATIKTQSAFGNSSAITLETEGPPAGTLAAGTTLQAVYEGSGLIPKEFADLARDMENQKLIQHMDEAVVSIRNQSERAGQLLESVKEIVADPKMREDLRISLANVRAATESANRVGANMERFTGSLDKVDAQANATLSDVRVAVAKLSTTLDHFESITNKMDQGKGTAGMLINDPKLYQSLVDASRELNSTIATLQRVFQQWEQEGVTLKLGK